MNSTPDYTALRAQTMGSGNDDEAVTVNTRALIDKVLARYSGEFTMLRELLQNAADASANKVTIRLKTLPSTKTPLPASTSDLLKHTVLHHTLKTLIVTNDGQPFGNNDWARLKRIAEGNPDESKIGAFGVGFYSVFSECEEPFISSGSSAMCFFWKGNSLFTRRLQLQASESSHETSFVLDYRNTTTPIPSFLPLCQFLANALTFVGLKTIELWLDDWRLIRLNKITAPNLTLKLPKELQMKTQESLMEILSVSNEAAQIQAETLRIVDWKRIVPSDTSPKGAQPTSSLRAFFSRITKPSDGATKEEEVLQAAIAEDLMGEIKATVFLHIHTAVVRTTINPTFSQELERATKKAPPKNTSIAILTSSFDENMASKENDIFSSVLPSKSGRVFIGFPTLQTTGLNAHIHAPALIPTVEREAIDLNARWVRTWNMEMLRAAGVVCRIAWSGEMETMKDKLSRVTSNAGRTKIAMDDIKVVIPAAIHAMNQFTFRESTPFQQVGNLVESAFWTCHKGASIDILSSRGVLPSEKVRTATDDLSFVEGIPVVPEQLMDKAKGFVEKLVEFGLVGPVSEIDVKQELETKALNADQLLEFLRYLSSHQSDAKSLLNVAIASIEEGPSGSGKIISLRDIKYWVNPSRISPEMPLPNDTIPFRFSKSLSKDQLNSFGWEDLQMVPWVKWLVENRAQLASEHNITQSLVFASTVLATISKQWDGLSSSSKTTIVDLLSPLTVIPTTRGLRKPTEAYQASVKKIFDDLPIVTLNSVKEKVLAAFGVRKTIELNLIFDRLMATSEKGGEAKGPDGKWSHVDLIKYLTSVYGDIPSEDIKRLKNTPLCPAESESISGERYRVSDLFEPSDVLRSLGLRLMQWPTLYRSTTPEGRFLSSQLGLRAFPTKPELISTISTATLQGDVALRDRALRYLLQFHHTNGYSQYNNAACSTPYLPLDCGDLKATRTPQQCFTNESAAIMGFDILRKDLRSEAKEKLGVQHDPEMKECIDKLVKNPPTSRHHARKVFEYFACRLAELGAYVELLGRSKFIPVFPKSQNANVDKSEKSRHIEPRLCFLGDGGKYVDIFEYVDYGQEANSFLLRCGSKHEPSTTEIAQLLIREPARIFGVLQVERYLELLRTLAESFSVLKKDRTLAQEMKNAPFLLAYSELSSGSTGADDVDTIKTYQLANARKIVVVDDLIAYNLFKSSLICAPMEDLLEDFYISLGAPVLHEIVEERYSIGKPTVTEDQRATKLQNLVYERVTLFLHEYPREAIKHNAKWLSQNLKVVSVSSITLRRSLKGHNKSHSESRSAALSQDQTGWTLCVTVGNYEVFEVSQALIGLLLIRPKPQHGMMLEMFLGTNLLKLRARGYNVERILRQKAVEARVAEEARKQQLLQEQQDLKEREAAWKESQAQSVANTQNPVSMPGLFPNSPDHKSLGNSVGTGGDDQVIRKPRGFLHDIGKRFGFEHGRRPDVSNLGGGNTSGGSNGIFDSDSPPPYSIDDKNKSPAPETATAPHRLQQNLVNAVESSRAYNSTSLVSQPTVNEVKETATYCDAKPSHNLKFVAESSSGVKMFFANDTEDQSFLAANGSALNAFSSILLDCAHVFNLGKHAVHIFYDNNGSTIAFNKSKALFCNYRYFENLHLPLVQQGVKADALVYWFVVLCHELAHNLVKDHSADHSYYTESFVIQYFGKMASTISAMHGEVRPVLPADPLLEGE